MTSPHIISIVISLLLLSSVAGAQTAGAVELEKMTRLDLMERDIRVLVLPIGSCEPHANHLYYANDTWTAEELAARVAREANEKGARVLVLPTMPYGINVNLTRIPHAQSLRPATMMQFVKDVVDTAEKQGIRKVVILNTHGGNTTTLGSALRELFATHPKVFVALVNASETWREKQREIIEKSGGHAGETETSVALFLYPDRVRMDKGVAPREAELKLKSMAAPYITFVKPWNYVSNTTGLGDPAGATAEKGRQLVEVFLERVSTFLKELSDTELTESFPF